MLQKGSTTTSQLERRIGLVDFGGGPCSREKLARPVRCVEQSVMKWTGARCLMSMMSCLVGLHLWPVKVL